MQTLSQKAPIVVRSLLGGLFVVFGLNGFLQFLPAPELPPAAGAFFGALAATGYMLPLIKGIEVVAGSMLLTGRFVPLALTLLAPIVVNIAAFHVVLAPNPVMPVFLVAAMGYLAWSYRHAFAPMLARRTTLRASSAGIDRFVPGA
jgi:uncharacterized membrane protein YphA (DoxX/SURF4 family)